MGAAENIPEVLLKLEQVEAQTGMKKSYIYREMKKGTFPPKLKIGGGSRWYQSDVQLWITTKREPLRWQPLYETSG
ncbi:TPA: helix-turn-helix transcriptional regulator [Stenotrophomonas maltophilia]